MAETQISVLLKVGSSNHRAPYSVGSAWNVYRGVKRPESETDCSPPVTAEVKKAWLCTLPPSSVYNMLQGQFYLRLLTTCLSQGILIFGFCKLIVSYERTTTFIDVFTIFRARHGTLKSTYVIMQVRCELLASDRGEFESYSYTWLSFHVYQNCIKEIQIIETLAYGYQNQAESG
jgi:hypothetical protein